MADKPAGHHRVQTAIETQLAHPGTYVDLADAACGAIFTIASNLERDHPEYADAYQALAERLGYT